MAKAATTPPRHGRRPATGGAPAGAARPRRRRWWKALAAVVVLVVAYLAVTFVQVWWTSRQDQARPADAIVVLGAAQYDGRPSPVLAARLDHALDLWRQGIAPTVVVTGGRRPGDRFTEATASANYLIERGVPDAAILREVRGRTTWESLVDAAGILQDRGLRTVVLVSDPYHSMRAAGIAREVGLEPFVSPTRTSPVRGSAEFRQLVKETGGVAIARFTGYRRLWRLDPPT